MALFDKIKWALGLTLVFFLILATNLIDRNNFIQVKDSIVTIYEDRLVAKYLIFEYAQLIHEKEVAVAASDTGFFNRRNQQVNQELASLTEQYRTTRLTDREEIVFKRFRDDLKNLKNMEAARNVNSDAYRSLLTASKEKLDELSKIQLQEGKNQVLLSEEAIADVELFTQLEIYFLFFLAILVQVIILYDPSSKAPESDEE